MSTCLPVYVFLLLLSKDSYMPSWFFSVGMRNQLGIARHLVLESAHEGRAWGQVYPAFAASFPDTSISPWRSDSSDRISPRTSPIFVPSISCQWEGQARGFFKSLSFKLSAVTVTIDSRAGFLWSRIKSAVAILVVLAGKAGTWACFSKRTAPESAFIRIAERALTSTSRGFPIRREAKQIKRQIQRTEPHW